MRKRKPRTAGFHQPEFHRAIVRATGDTLASSANKTRFPRIGAGKDKLRYSWIERGRNIGVYLRAVGAVAEQKATRGLRKAAAAASAAGDGRRRFLRDGGPRAVPLKKHSN